MDARSATIAVKDRLEIVRDLRMRIAVGVVLLLSLAAVVAAVVRVSDHARDRKAAIATEQRSWLGQGARDPHSAAHFAQWTFRPVEGVALLDPGATPHAGSAIWLEAHARNPAAFRPVEDRTVTLDVGEPSAAWVIQTLGPLLAFLVAAGLVARERERGTLRMMLASGVSSQRLMTGKARGLLVTLLLIAAPVFLAALVAIALSPGLVDADMATRFVLWVCVHLVWLAIAGLVGLTVSAASRTTAGALMTLFAVWVLAAPLAPRAAASLAKSIHPTPSGARFWAEAQAEIREGFDGSGSQAERTAALQASLLQQYGVARVEDLPVSFRGASLDASERFGNLVFERRFEQLDSIYDKQRAVMRWAAVATPMVALQNISSALAGTDNRHLRAFEEQAEAERQRVVNALNADLTHNAVGNANYRADETLWRKFEPFQPDAVPVRTALMAIWIDVAILLGWLAIAVLLLVASSRRLAREHSR